MEGNLATDDLQHAEVMQESIPDARLRRLSLAWPLGLMALVLYGSLIPFGFDWSVFQPSSAWGLLRIHWHPATLEDAVANVLLYIPIGFALVASNRRLNAAGASPVFQAIALGAIASVVAETWQTGLSVRVASWTDVVLNTVGVAVGAIPARFVYRLGVHLSARVRLLLAERTFATLASVLTVGLFAYGLAPFDFITSTNELHAAFRQAGWNPTAPFASLFSLGADGGVLDQLPGALWFSALGYLLVLAGRQAGRDRMSAAVFSLKHGFVSAGLLGVTQVFTLSHEFEPVAIILRCLAVALGAYGASVNVGALSCEARVRRPWSAVPTTLIAALATVQILMLFLSSAAPDLLALHAADLSRVHWIPFETLRNRSAVMALLELVGSTATFGALALTLIVLLRRVKISAMWAVAATTLFGIAMLSEFFRTCNASRTADMTGPVLAMFTLAGLYILRSRILPTASAAGAISHSASALSETQT